MSIHEICASMGYSLAELKCKSRNPDLVRKRKAASFQLYRRGISQVAIASEFNCTQSGISRLISSYTTKTSHSHQSFDQWK